MVCKLKQQTMHTFILIAATIGTGLMAGLFYAWSISVTPGLANVSNVIYLHAFQSMNRAIINPIFLIPFMGLLLLLPTLCYLFGPSTKAMFWYLLAATLIYYLGVMAVTLLGNIPLNEALEALQLPSLTAEEMATFRQGFERKWNNLNTIRTGCSLLSFALMVMACLQVLKC